MSNDELRGRVSRLSDNISSLKGGADELTTKNEHNYDQIDKEGALLMKAEGIQTPDEYRAKLLATLPEEHRKQVQETLDHLHELGENGHKLTRALTIGLGVAASGKLLTIVGRKVVENFGTAVARGMWMIGFRLIKDGQKVLGLRAIANAGRVGRLYLKEVDAGSNTTKFLRSLERTEGWFTKAAKWLFVADIIFMIVDIQQSREEHDKLVAAIQELVPSRFQAEELLMEFRATANLWDSVRKLTTETEVEATDDNNEKTKLTPEEMEVVKRTEEKRRAAKVKKFITQYEEEMALITDEAIWKALEAYDQGSVYKGADPSKEQVHATLNKWAAEAKANPPAAS